MAAPTMPTSATIIEEGAKKALRDSIPADVTTRGTLWLEEIKNDLVAIFGAKKLEFLQSSRVLALTDGLSTYSQPADFYSNMSMVLIDGEEQGTAQAGDTNKLTLASASTISAADMIGKKIYTTGGTGPNQVGQCIAYDFSTKVAIISGTWGATPDNTTTYLVANSYRPLTETPLWEFKYLENPTIKDRPRLYSPKGSADNGEFELYPVPYRNVTGFVYVIEQKYYADLMELDLSGTLIGTLYKRWRNMWVQGVFAKTLESTEDARADREMQNYRGMVQAIAVRETYGGDLSNMNITVSDYS
jgi:hypothetical protein